MKCHEIEWDQYAQTIKKKLFLKSHKSLGPEELTKASKWNSEDNEKIKFTAIVSVTTQHETHTKNDVGEGG